MELEWPSSEYLKFAKQGPVKDKATGKFVGLVHRADTGRRGQSVHYMFEVGGVIKASSFKYKELKGMVEG